MPNTSAAAPSVELRAPGDVEPAGVPHGLVEVAGRGDDRGEADRHVEEEAVAPRQRLGQRAADDQARGGADAGQRAVGGHRARALLALGEARRQQRQRRRRQRGGADALHGAGGDHPSRRLRQADGQRGGGEQADAEHERAPAPEQVTGARAEQQQPAERQRVGVLRPRQAGVAETQVGADAGQRRHQDRDVDQDQQVAGEDDRQHHAPPSPGAVTRASAAGHEPQRRRARLRRDHRLDVARVAAVLLAERGVDGVVDLVTGGQEGDVLADAAGIDLSVAAGPGGAVPAPPSPRQERT